MTTYSEYSETLINVQIAIIFRNSTSAIVNCDLIILLISITWKLEFGFLVFLL